MIDVKAVEHLEALLEMRDDYYWRYRDGIDTLSKFQRINKQISAEYNKMLAMVYPGSPIETGCECGLNHIKEAA